MSSHIARRTWLKFQPPSLSSTSAFRPSALFASPRVALSSAMERSAYARGSIPFLSRRAGSSRGHSTAAAPFNPLARYGELLESHPLSTKAGKEMGAWGGLEK